MPVSSNPSSNSIQDGSSQSRRNNETQAATSVASAPPASDQPWWKRYSSKFWMAFSFLLFGALAAVIGVMVGRGITTTAATTPAADSTTSTPSTTAQEDSFEGNSSVQNPTNVRFLQTLFDEDCDDCFPVFAIDGDTAVATKDFESIQFFSMNNDNFELEATIPIDYEVWDISLFGDVAVVGAPYEDDKTGAVYVYEHSPVGGWKQTARIVPDDIIGEQALFGEEVSLYDDVFVVGAPYEWDDFDNEGFAYVYRRSGSTWRLETKLVPDKATLDQYGRSVSIVGNMLAVGDWNQVFVFYFDYPTNSWKQYGDRILNDDCDNWFGAEVVLTSNNGLLIGCQDEITRDNAGAVYYYEQSGNVDKYVLRQEIMASDAGDEDEFGGRNEIAVDGDVMVVGTYLEANGKAYVFTKVGNEWNEVSIINAPDGSVPSFGYRVAISQNKVLVYSVTNVYTYGFDIKYSPTTTTTTTTTTAQKCFGNVHFLQTLFDEDCGYNCYPGLAIDGDTAVASKNEKSLHFFSINNGNFKLETTIPINSYVYDISLVGDVDVVGAPFKDSYNTGAVYVYERSSLGEWEQTMRTVPKDLWGGFAWFGRSVSLSDDVFVVVAGFANAAYIYRRSGSTWELETKLVPEYEDGRMESDSVSIVSNVVAVGDDMDGRVFVFHFDSSSNSWKQLGEPIANDDCILGFGTDVELTSDNGLLIGCQDESTINYDAGAVYYYGQSEGDGEFVFRQKIMASDAADGDLFGGENRIAVNGDVMVVGTYLETNGKAYVFTKVENEWNEVAIINAPDGSGHYFGYRVAISQNKVLVYSDTNVYTYGLDIGYC